MSRLLGVDMTARVEAYEATVRPAREAYEATVRPAREAYRATRDQAWEAYEATQRQAWEAYEATGRRAWEALKCGDPLVDWIIDNCEDYQEQALEILALLPVSIEILDDYAAEQGWCETWQDLLDAAERAGVLV